MISLSAWVVLSLLSAVFSAALARRKGRAVRYWMSMGFLLGPIGLLAAVLMPSVRKEESQA